MSYYLNWSQVFHFIRIGTKLCSNLPILVLSLKIWIDIMPYLLINPIFTNHPQPEWDRVIDAQVSALSWGWNLVTYAIGRWCTYNIFKIFYFSMLIEVKTPSRKELLNATYITLLEEFNSSGNISESPTKLKYTAP